MKPYKGYDATTTFDEERLIFSGRVINISDAVQFEGRTPKEFVQAFHDAVDDYLALCQELGRKPARPYSGKLMLRMPPGLHRQLALEAEAFGASLNKYILLRLSEPERFRNLAQSEDPSSARGHG